MSSVYETMLDEARNSGYSVTIMSRVAIEGNDKKVVTSPEEGSSVKSKHKELGVDEMLSFQILQTVLERDKVNSRNSSSSKDSKDSKDSLHSQYVVFPKLDGDNNKIQIQLCWLRETASLLGLLRLARTHHWATLP